LKGAKVAVVIADVLAMIPEYDVTKDYSWALSDANALMSAAFAANPSIPTAQQDLVIKYLAAHFVLLEVERGGLVRNRVGDADVSYTGDRAVTGFMLTRYGQQAVMFDTTRTLAKLSQAQKGTANLSVLSGAFVAAQPTRPPLPDS
jgi:hypothetical protein